MIFKIAREIITKKTPQMVSFLLAERMGYISTNVTMAKLNRWVQNNHSVKQKTPKRVFLALAERMGFEPMCRKPDNRISSAARYDHFDTFPYQILSCK